ncbi:C-terminal domain-containing protein [Hexamita inflata]|uniref:C-terminal domain-containing protein n=1 Tax=Hexamita inflata TaxID=28002 RepID=A0ABP1HV05_9EUKA
MLCICASRQSDHSGDIAQLKQTLPDFQVVEFSSNVTPIANKPFIWFGSSGGTENNFLKLNLSSLPLPVILYSVPTDNSSAAAQEVSFYMRQRLIPQIHCKTLKQLQECVKSWSEYNKIIKSIQEQNILRIGGYSDWLINENDQFYKQSLPKIVNVSVEQFMAETKPNHDLQIQGQGDHVNAHVKPASEVYSRLKQELEKYNAKALTVKCFDLLTTYQHHAACYPYAQLQNEGILCACEGEVSSMIGMIMLRAATGNNGIFMCNYLKNEGKVYKFAHCTAPLCGLEQCGQTQEFRLRTHYETKDGLAVTVQIQEQEVIVFKLRLGDNCIAQVLSGKIVKSRLDDIEECQCRTQIEVELDNEVEMIGNHYLVVKKTQAGYEQLKKLMSLFGFFMV